MSVVGDVAKCLSALEHQVNGIKAQDTHQMERSLSWLEAWRGAQSSPSSCTPPHPVPTEIPESSKELSLSTLTQSSVLIGNVAETSEASPASVPLHLLFHLPGMPFLTSWPGPVEFVHSVIQQVLAGCLLHARQRAMLWV